MTDELLVVRCQLGEPDALAELVRAWHMPVWTYVRRTIGPADADDVTQEAWIAVLRGLPRLRQPARFKPWLFTITRRAVLNRLREEGEPESTGRPCSGESVNSADDIPNETDRYRVQLDWLPEIRVPCSAHVAVQPVGTTWTFMRRRHRGQKRGGSNARARWQASWTPG